MARKRLSRSSRKKKERTLKSNTTILAFCYADGIICAADKKLSVDDSIVTTEYEKINAVSDHSYILGSGSVWLIQHLCEMVSEHVRAYATEHGSAMSVYEQAKYLAETCREEADEDDFGGILAGADADGSHRMFRVDDEGTVVPCSRYIACGSGGESAMVTLELLWPRAWLAGLDLTRGIELAIRAIAVAALHDNGTSDPRVVPPSIASISMGAAVIPPHEVARMCEVLFTKERAMQERIKANPRFS